MHYAILFICLLAHPLNAQSALSGLGTYQIGITTPASLNPTAFKEQDPPLVKGTIALACEHIRVFKAPEQVIETTSVTNLTLIFYDNRLAKIACNYSPELNTLFRSQYGAGLSLPKSRGQLCPEKKGKPMDMWREIWQQADVVALAIRVNGYDKACASQDIAQLTVASWRQTELSSDCDVQSADPFAEEFREVLNLLREKQPAGKDRDR
ncbi:hypothetical protein [Spirosoma koreense]